MSSLSFLILIICVILFFYSLIWLEFYLLYFFREEALGFIYFSVLSFSSFCSYLYYFHSSIYDSILSTLLA